MTNKEDKNRSFLAEGLEQRMLLDAAGAIALDDVSNEMDAEVAEDIANSEGENASNDADILARAIDSLDSNLQKSPDSRQVIIVDSALADETSLFESFEDNIEIITLDAIGDPIEQIENIINSGAPIASLHIFSHGGEGVLELGGSRVDFTNLSQKQADQLISLGENFTENGDIIVYGCNFAAGEKGETAAAILAGFTGADVAASDDLTGSEELGGDWYMEFKVGVIEAENPFGDSVPVNFDNVLDFNVDGKRIMGWIDLSDKSTLINTDGNTLEDDPTNTNILKIRNKGVAGGFFEKVNPNSTITYTEETYVKNGVTYSSQPGLSIPGQGFMLDNSGFHTGGSMAHISSYHTPLNGENIGLFSVGKPTGGTSNESFYFDARYTASSTTADVWRFSLSIRNRGEEVAGYNLGASDFGRANHLVSAHIIKANVTTIGYSEQWIDRRSSNYNPGQKGYSDARFTVGTAEGFKGTLYETIYAPGWFNDLSIRKIGEHMNAYKGWDSVTDTAVTHVQRGYHYDYMTIGRDTSQSRGHQNLSRWEMDGVEIVNIDAVAKRDFIRIANNNEEGANYTDSRTDSANDEYRSAKIWRFDAQKSLDSKARLIIDLSEAGLGDRQDVITGLGIAHNEVDDFVVQPGGFEVNDDKVTFTITANNDDVQYATLLFQGDMTLDAPDNIVNVTKNTYSKVLSSVSATDRFVSSDDWEGFKIEVSRKGGANAKDVWNMPDPNDPRIGSLSTAGGKLTLEIAKGISRADALNLIHEVQYKSDTNGINDFDLKVTSGGKTTESLSDTMSISVADVISTRPEITPANSAASYKVGDATKVDVGFRVSDSNIKDDYLTVVLSVDSGRLSIEGDHGIDYLDGEGGSNNLTIKGTAAELNAALAELTYYSDSAGNHDLEVVVKDEGDMYSMTAEVALSPRGNATFVSPPANVSGSYDSNGVATVQLGNSSASFSDAEAGRTYTVEVYRHPAPDSSDTFTSSYGSSTDGKITMSANRTQINNMLRNLQMQNNDRTDSGDFSVAWKITDDLGATYLHKQQVTLTDSQGNDAPPKIVEASSVSTGDIAHKETYTFSLDISEAVNLDPSMSLDDVMVNFLVGDHTSKEQTATLLSISPDGTKLTFVSDLNDEGLIGTDVTILANTLTNGLRDSINQSLALESDILLDNVLIDTTDSDAIISVADPSASTDGDDNTGRTEDQVTITIQFDEDLEVEGFPKLELKLDDGSTVLADFASSENGKLTFVYDVEFGDDSPSGFDLGKIQFGYEESIVSKKVDGSIEDWLSASAVEGTRVDDVGIEGNRPPEGVDFTKADYISSNTAGVTVGTLAGVDPDLTHGDSVSLDLLSVTGTNLTVDDFIIVNGELKLKADKSFDKFAGTSISITFKVTDSKGLEAEETINFDINAENLVPEAKEGADISLTKSRGQDADTDLNQYIDDLFSDPEGSDMTVVEVLGLPNGVTFDPATGKLSGTFLDIGNFSITIKVADEVGLTAVNTISLEITAPQAINDAERDNGAAKDDVADAQSFIDAKGVDSAEVDPLDFRTAPDLDLPSDRLGDRSKQDDLRQEASGAGSYHDITTKAFDNLLNTILSNGEKATTSAFDVAESADVSSEEVSRRFRNYITLDDLVSPTSRNAVDEVSAFGVMPTVRRADGGDMPYQVAVNSLRSSLQAFDIPLYSSRAITDVLQPRQVNPGAVDQENVLFTAPSESQGGREVATRERLASRLRSYVDSFGGGS